MTKQRKQALSSVFFTYILLILSTSCRKNSERVNNDFFEFSIDKNMEVENIKYSMYSGIYVFNAKDTAFYNFGYWISTLAEIPWDVIYMDNMENYLPDSIGQKYFTTNRNFDKDRLREQNIFFYRKNNEIRKYTIPVDTIRGGMVGVFIDSLRSDQSGVLKFNFFMNNLNSVSYTQAIRIIHSISMHNNSIDSNDFRSTLIVE
jgi:hypothetical protein